MRKTLIILIAMCLIFSGMINSAYAAKIQSTDLTPAEVDAFSQAQTDSAQTINNIDDPGHVMDVFTVIGIVVVVLIVVAVSH